MIVLPRKSASLTMGFRVSSKNSSALSSKSFDSSGVRLSTVVRWASRAGMRGVFTPRALVQPAAIRPFVVVVVVRAATGKDAQAARVGPRLFARALAPLFSLELAEA